MIFARPPPPLRESTSIMDGPLYLWYILVYNIDFFYLQLYKTYTCNIFALNILLTFIQEDIPKYVSVKARILKNHCYCFKTIKGLLGVSHQNYFRKEDCNFRPFVVKRGKKGVFPTQKSGRSTLWGQLSYQCLCVLRLT